MGVAVLLESEVRTMEESKHGSLCWRLRLVAVFVSGW